MRILCKSEFCLPSVGGAKEILRQISERLVCRGHKVIVAATKLAKRNSDVINGVDIEEFAFPRNAVADYNGDTMANQAFRRKSSFDIAMICPAQQWTADISDNVLHDISAAKVFVPCGLSELRMEANRAYCKDLPEILDHRASLLFHSDSYQEIPQLASSIEYFANATVARDRMAAIGFEAFQQCFSWKHMIIEDEQAHEETSHRSIKRLRAA